MSLVSTETPRTFDELSQLTNWQLMNLLIPDIDNKLAEASRNNMETIRSIDQIGFTDQGFRPFSKEAKENGHWDLMVTVFPDLEERMKSEPEVMAVIQHREDDRQELVEGFVGFQPFATFGGFH